MIRQTQSAWFKKITYVQHSTQLHIFQGRGLAECVDNVTFAHGGLFNLKSLERLSGMVCRSTAIPMFTNDSEKSV